MPQELDPSQANPPAPSPVDPKPSTQPLLPNMVDPKTEPPKTEQVAQPDRLAKLRELGFDDVKDENEGFDRLVQAYRRQDEMKHQITSLVEEVRSLRAPEQPKQPAADPQQATDWWNPPPVNMHEVQKYRDASGGWKPETPHEVRQQADAYQRYIDSWTDKLVRNPKEAFKPIIDSEVRRIVEEMLGQTTAQQQEQQLRTKIFEENPWLFEVDPVTNRRAVDIKGMPVLSREGQLINELMVEAMDQDGMSFERAWKYAEAVYKANKLAAGQVLTGGAAPPEQDNSPQALAERRKQELLESGRNRSGSLPAAGGTTVPNRNLSAGQRFVQTARQLGTSLG